MNFRPTSRKKLYQNRSTRFLRLFVAAILVGICLFLTLPYAITLAADIGDYLRHPAETSPQSRWYTLSEIGIGSVSHAIDFTGPDTSPKSVDEGVIDLSDRRCWPSLTFLWDRRVLTDTEPWENGIDSGHDTVGYPSVVRNIHGPDADGKFYLYYAIHDPYSGIAVAISNSIDGTFHKLKQLHPLRPDSRVLRAPKRPRNTSHFSSPVVLWNPQERRWFMYFHFYQNEWSSGHGHQRTALAVTESLSSNHWTPWTDSRGRLLAVLPTTHARWMNSQSSYHSIDRLPNGTWLAFLRGVGGQYDGTKWEQDPAMLGFAISHDGRRWAQVPGNPQIYQNDGRHGRSGVYRPLFVVKLRDHLLLAWSESNYYDSNPRIVLGRTRDLRSITPVTDSQLSEWRPADGAMSAWRAGDRLYFFYGNRQRAFRMLDTCGATPTEVNAYVQPK